MGCRIIFCYSLGGNFLFDTRVVIGGGINGDGTKPVVVVTSGWTTRFEETAFGLVDDVATVLLRLPAKHSAS